MFVVLLKTLIFQGISHFNEYDVIKKYGVTICCDGWDNVQNQPLLNIVQCGTKGMFSWVLLTPQETTRIIPMLLLKFDHLCKWLVDIT